MGLFDWTKRKTKNTAEEAKKYIGAEEIRENASFIVKMGKVLFSPKKMIEESRQETFLEAKTRLRLTDFDIMKTYKNNVYSFYISFVFAIVCLYFVLVNLLDFKLLGFASTLSIMILCLVQCFRFSFRSFQIRHQKLCPPKDWLSRPGEWFPTIG